MWLGKMLQKFWKPNAGKVVNNFSVHVVEGRGEEKFIVAPVLVYTGGEVL
jgi:hypothetical protein